MALVLTLKKNKAAVLGRPTGFVLSVLNNGASAVNVLSVDPVITSAAGQVGVPYLLGGPYASPNQSEPSVTSKFNVQIPASGTAYFTFFVTFMGAQVAGMPATGPLQFRVAAAVTDDTGTVSVPPALNVTVAQPAFGRPPGSPPNAELNDGYGALDFHNSANSAFTAIG